METTPNTNIPPFYIGQKVVKISTETIHTVTGIQLASCGCWCVDIGLKARFATSRCIEHNKIVLAASDIEWHKSYTLRPVQEAKMIRVSFEKIVEEIPVVAN